MVKVTVIVPTFRPGSRLSLVVDSLDAQSLPADEFEVIFVDDGSGDDTVERLEAIAATRSNMRIIQIENSGWGSRPRNVGVQAALGQYVTFMDHDDSLFPDALRSAYEAGSAIAADFVNPKEVVDRGWSWGWDVWNVDRSLTTRSQMHPRDVTPLMPHKLYRRQFLLDHDIRFPEGRRAFFEDFYFNTEVFAHANAIAILASVPFYTWHRNTGNNSSNSLYDSVEVYWNKLAEVARFMTGTVAEDDARRWLLINHYRWWVIDLFGPRMLKRDPAFIRDSLPAMSSFLQNWVPDDADTELEQAQRATAHLMRAADLDALIELAHIDAGTSATADTVELKWTSEGLHVIAGATWVDAEELPLMFQRRDGRLYRVLGGRLQQSLPEDILDVTDAVDAAWGWLTIRSRATRVSWRIPTTSTVHLDEVDGRVSVRIVVEGVLSPEEAVFGQPLDDGLWDVGARFSMMGNQSHSGVRYGGGVRASVRDDRSAVAHKNGRGILAVDLGATSKSALAAPRLDIGSASSPRVAGIRGRSIRVPLKAVAVTDGSIAVAVRFDGSEPVAATVRATPAGTELVVDAPSASGTHTWSVAIGTEDPVALAPFTIDVFGRVRFRA